jgi:hypothetical protein
MEVSDYKMVTALTAWGLQRVVKKSLSQGWKLQGGGGRTFFGFYQSMTK